METQQRLNRHADNLGILTGRHAGKFFQDGSSRGGGGGRTEQEIFTLYEANLSSFEEVCGVLGISDDGGRTPYEELHAQVIPKRMRRVTLYDSRGIPVETQEQEL